MTRTPEEDDKLRADILIMHENVILRPRKKFHRDAKEIPTDPKERKARVRWVQNHRVWEYPVLIRSPENFEDRFVPVEGGRYHEWVPEKPEWPEHEALLGSFHECVEIDFVYVAPGSWRIENDDEKNTEIEVWIEAGPWHDQSKDPGGYVPEGGWNKYNKWCKSHDVRLDCGGGDLLEAILELACRVEFFYGEGCEDLPTASKHCEGSFKDNVIETSHYVSACIPDTDGYCMTCGFAME